VYPIEGQNFPSKTRIAETFLHAHIHPRRHITLNSDTLNADSEDLTMRLADQVLRIASGVDGASPRGG
jgi:hypothetical protein